MPERLGPPAPSRYSSASRSIGFGLIGSSIARAARQQNLARTIVAIDRDEAVLERVQRARPRRRGDDRRWRTAVRGRRPRHPLRAGRRLRRRGAGDAAGAAARRHRLRRRLGEVHRRSRRSRRTCRRASISFPRTRSPAPSIRGPDAGFATLFLNRWCILTPPRRHDAGRRSSGVRDFWDGDGRPMSRSMTAEHHDLVLAITSHVPHLIAYNIVGTAADLETVTQSEVIKFSAGGFRDFTRIAASDPTMWRDVFLHNKDAVLEMLGRFNEDLSRSGARHPLGRGRQAVRPVHAHARHPAWHHRWARKRRSPISAAAGRMSQDSAPSFRSRTAEPAQLSFRGRAAEPGTHNRWRSRRDHNGAALFGAVSVYGSRTPPRAPRDDGVSGIIPICTPARRESSARRLRHSGAAQRIPEP